MNAERIFKKLSTSQKAARLKAEGEYLGNRRHTAYDIHLYSYRGMFVEVWMKIGLNWIYFIDIQKNREILEHYMPHFDAAAFFNKRGDSHQGPTHGESGSE